MDGKTGMDINGPTSLDESSFDGMHRLLERLEGAGRLRILRAETERRAGRYRVVRIVLQRVA